MADSKDDDAIANAVKADRERRRAIMALDEAKDRETLAAHLADTTELTVDVIKGTLAVSPKASKEGVDLGAYDAARAEGQQGAGAGAGGKPTGSKAVAIDRAKIFASRRPAAA